MVIVDFLPNEGNDSVIVRQLLRRATEAPGAGLKPNELVYTDDSLSCGTGKLNTNAAFD
jgi:hypothetical protein